jgi:predicted RND superfamily exporter protein
MFVKELCDRYSLQSRKSLYSRLDAVGLKLPKDDDGKAYATPEMLQQLDDLDQHLKNGGSLKNYTPVTSVTTHLETNNNGNNLDDTTQTTQLTTHKTTQMNREELLEVIEVLGTAIASRLQPIDPIGYNNSLEQAQQLHWILSTSEVKQLIGNKPSCPKGENVFIRGCWAFTKAGKIGNQTGWRVNKIDPNKQFETEVNE